MVIKKVNLDIVIGVTSAIPDTEFPGSICGQIKCW